MKDFTAVVKQDGDWWIGWIEEVPGVNCQERTKDELLETLKVTLEEARWNSIGKMPLRLLAGTIRKKISPYEAKGTGQASSFPRL